MYGSCEISLSAQSFFAPPEVSLIGAEHLDIQDDTLEELPLQSDQSAGKSEYERIVQVLKENRWNRRRVAEKLDIPYSTLRYKMDKLGISREWD